MFSDLRYSQVAVPHRPFHHVQRHRTLTECLDDQILSLSKLLSENLQSLLCQVSFQLKGTNKQNSRFMYELKRLIFPRTSYMVGKHLWEILQMIDLVHKNSSFFTSNSVNVKFAQSYHLRSIFSTSLQRHPCIYLGWFHRTLILHGHVYAKHTYFT